MAPFQGGKEDMFGGDSCSSSAGVSVPARSKQNEHFRELQAHLRQQLQAGATNASVMQCLANMCREEEDIRDRQTLIEKQDGKKVDEKKQAAKVEFWRRRFMRRSSNQSSSPDVPEEDEDVNLFTKYVKQKYRGTSKLQPEKPFTFSENIQDILFKMTSQFAADINTAYETDETQIMAKGDNNPMDAVKKMQAIENNMKAIDEDMKILAKTKEDGIETATHFLQGFQKLGTDDCILSDYQSSSDSSSSEESSSSSGDSDSDSEDSDSDDSDSDDSGSDDSSDDDSTSECGSEWDGDSDDESSIDSDFMAQMENELGFEVPVEDDVSVDVSLVKAIASGKRPAGPRVTSVAPPEIQFSSHASPQPLSPLRPPRGSLPRPISPLPHGLIPAAALHHTVVDSDSDSDDGSDSSDEESESRSESESGESEAEAVTRCDSIIQDAILNEVANPVHLEETAQTKSSDPVRVQPVSEAQPVVPQCPLMSEAMMQQMNAAIDESSDSESDGSSDSEDASDSEDDANSESEDEEAGQADVVSSTPVAAVAEPSDDRKPPEGLIAEVDKPALESACESEEDSDSDDDSDEDSEDYSDDDSNDSSLDENYLAQFASTLKPGRPKTAPPTAPPQPPQPVPPTGLPDGTAELMAILGGNMAPPSGQHAASPPSTATSTQSSSTTSSKKKRYFPKATGIGANVGCFDATGKPNKKAIRPSSDLTETLNHHEDYDQETDLCIAAKFAAAADEAVAPFSIAVSTPTPKQTRAIPSFGSEGGQMSATCDPGDFFVSFSDFAMPDCESEDEGTKPNHSQSNRSMFSHIAEGTDEGADCDRDVEAMTASMLFAMEEKILHASHPNVSSDESFPSGSEYVTAEEDGEESGDDLILCWDSCGSGELYVSWSDTEDDNEETESTPVVSSWRPRRRLTRASENNSRRRRRGVPFAGAFRKMSSRISSRSSSRTSSPSPSLSPSCGLSFAATMKAESIHDAAQIVRMLDLSDHDSFADDASEFIVSRMETNPPHGSVTRDASVAKGESLRNKMMLPPENMTTLPTVKRRGFAFSNVFRNLATLDPCYMYHQETVQDYPVATGQDGLSQPHPTKEDEGLQETQSVTAPPAHKCEENTLDRTTQPDLYALPAASPHPEQFSLSPLPSEKEKYFHPVAAASPHPEQLSLSPLPTEQENYFQPVASPTRKHSALQDFPKVENLSPPSTTEPQSIPLSPLPQSEEKLPSPFASPSYKQEVSFSFSSGDEEDHSLAPSPTTSQNVSFYLPPPPPKATDGLEKDQPDRFIFPKIDFDSKKKGKKARHHNPKKGDENSLNTRRRRKTRDAQMKAKMQEEKDYIQGLMLVDRTQGRTVGGIVKSQI